MKQISSKTTFLSKKIMPFLWFGILGIYLIGVLLSDKWQDKPALIIMPLIMLLFGYYIMKKLTLDLIDKVYDDGAYLYFKNGNTKLRINYKDIKNISYQVATNPPRVTLSLRYDTPLGKELSFLPLINFIPLKKNEFIENLIERISNARG